MLDKRNGRRHLFDLRSDPAETRDIASERPGLATALAESLGAADDSLPTPEDIDERVRALGYVR